MAGVEAQKLLSDLEVGPDVPASVKADAGFARVSRVMTDAAGAPLDDAARDKILTTIRDFDAAYPGDRRMAGLLTEVATLYDSLPAQKNALLEEAYSRATDSTLRSRINDDLKRLMLLGRPLDISLLPWQGGAPIKLAACRGRVAVILFLGFLVNAGAARTCRNEGSRRGVPGTARRFLRCQPGRGPIRDASHR